MSSSGRTCSSWGRDRARPPHGSRHRVGRLVAVEHEQEAAAGWPTGSAEPTSRSCTAARPPWAPVWATPTRPSTPSSPARCCTTCPPARSRTRCWPRRSGCCGQAAPSSVRTACPATTCTSSTRATPTTRSSRPRSYPAAAVGFAAITLPSSYDLVFHRAQGEIAGRNRDAGAGVGQRAGSQVTRISGNAAAPTPRAAGGRAPRKLARMSQPVSFYEAVGGEEFFTRLVHRFYQGVADDPVLRPVYPAKDLGPAEEHLRLFLMQYWGGPRTYDELRGHPRLRMRHARFAIGEAERDAWLHHMRVALDEFEPGRGARRPALGLPGHGRAQPGQRGSRARAPGPRAEARLTMDPLLRRVDCVQIPVPDLDAGLRFYRDGLGLELKWRQPPGRAPARRQRARAADRRPASRPTSSSTPPRRRSAGWRSSAGRCFPGRRTSRSAGWRWWPTRSAIRSCS